MGPIIVGVTAVLAYLLAGGCDNKKGCQTKRDDPTNPWPRGPKIQTFEKLMSFKYDVETDTYYDPKSPGLHYGHETMQKMIQDSQERAMNDHPLFRGR